MRLLWRPSVVVIHRPEIAESVMPLHEVQRRCECKSVRPREPGRVVDDHDRERPRPVFEHVGAQWSAPEFRIISKLLRPTRSPVLVRPRSYFIEDAVCGPDRPLKCETSEASPAILIDRIPVMSVNPVLKNFSGEVWQEGATSRLVLAEVLDLPPSPIFRLQAAEKPSLVCLWAQDSLNP